MTSIRRGRLEMLLAALVTGLLLGACGGGGDGDQTPAVRYSKMVIFGDSLSDVGSYATPGVLASGGGKYTINSADATIWVEKLAAQLGVAAPCAAQTGLQSSGPLAALAAPVTNVTGCFDYAQGGARVTNPVGVANQALIGLGDTSGYLGQLTDPVVNQINRHLAAAGGAFDGSELVTVLAGGNDVFLNLATVSATVAAGGDPNAAGAAAVTAMGTAGGELAQYVKALIVAKGATHVVVVNLPDVSKTPLAFARDAATQGLILQMSTVFNQQLAAGLAGTAGVVVVDAFTQNQDQVAHPEQYTLTNVTDTACDPVKAPLGALTCTANTLIAAAASGTDLSHYQYADSVHPTPYGYQLLAQFVAIQMAKAGWI